MNALTASITRRYCLLEHNVWLQRIVWFVEEDQIKTSYLQEALELSSYCTSLLVRAC